MPRRKRTDAQVMAHSVKCRAERLNNRTKAEMRLCELLDDQRIMYEVERIFLNGDRHIAVDFYFKSALLAVEVDGSAHDDSKSYDAGRDRWLFQQYGVRTLRLKNQEVLGSPKLAIQKVLDGSAAAYGENGLPAMIEGEKWKSQHRL